MNIRQVRLALVGLGMAAKPHLSALAQLGAMASSPVCLAGVHNRSRTKAEQIAAQFGCHCYDSLEEIADDPDVEGVILLTPPDQRLEPIRHLAQAGKAILCEKPIERDVLRATEIVEICEENRVLLGIVFQHRFRAGAKALSRLVRDKALGSIGLVRTEIPWWRDQVYYDAPGRGSYDRDGGGVLITQAIHVMDLMLSLTAPITSVQAFCATSKLHDLEAEDFVSAGLTYADGAVGSLVATTASFPGATESIRLDGTLGSAHLEGGRLTVHWRDGRTQMVDDISEAGGGADPMDFPCDWHRDLIADFAEAIRTENIPKITGREGLKVHHLIEALEPSSHEGSRIKLEP